MSKYLKVANSKNYVQEWKSKGISDESIKPLPTSNNFLNSLLECSNKLKLKFNGSCLRQDKITFDHGRKINIYIVYEIGKTFNIGSYPTPGNHLFVVVSLTKNDDNGKYKYSGYGIGLDRHGCFYILVVELVEM